MKKILITFVLFIIGFISFGYCQFYENVSVSPDGDGCIGVSYMVDSYGDYIRCYIPIDTYSITCNNHNYYIGVHYNRQNHSYSCEGGQTHILNIPSDVATTVYIDYIDRDYNFSYTIKSSKMPVSALSPAVSSIFTVTGQIIPYVVYIGIGVLLVTLGFFAIKWLVNWLVNKITKYFR